MGQPLRVGIRHERYSRVKDLKAFDSNFESAFGKKDVNKTAGRTTILYKNGQRIVLREQNKWVAPEGVADPTLAKKILPGGISAYDALTAGSSRSLLADAPTAVKQSDKLFQGK